MWSVVLYQLQFNATKAATLIIGYGHALGSPTGCLGSGQTMSLSMYEL